MDGEEALKLARRYTKNALSGMLDVGTFHTDSDGNLVMDIEGQTSKEFFINENGELEVEI